MFLAKSLTQFKPKVCSCKLWYCNFCIIKVSIPPSSMLILCNTWDNSTRIIDILADYQSNFLWENNFRLYSNMTLTSKISWIEEGLKGDTYYFYYPHDGIFSLLCTLERYRGVFDFCGSEINQVPPISLLLCPMFQKHRFLSVKHI